METLNTERPRLKISLKTIDWTLEFTSVVFLVLLISLPAFKFGTLPDLIPVHFNAAGEADDYGSRDTLWLLPAIGIIFYVAFTFLALVPHIYNFPVRITTENAPVQYKLAVRFIRSLKVIFLILFTFIVYQTITLAEGKSSGLGKIFLPVFLTVTFGTVIIYFVQSLNNRESS